ncbi:MAG: hypothetical protein HYX78_11575 [Armatimonadetes bacterium]|nr:hypothetical protein [Armatimonadota bacterium]
MKRLIWIILVLCIGAFQLPARAEDTPPARAEAAIPMSERPVLAIVAFDDGSIKRESWWGPNWDLGGGLADILTTVMLDTNRFRLVERELLNKVMAEQDLGATARVNQSTAVKIGKILGVDCLVMGKVTQFAWETGKKGGLIGIAGGIAGVGVSKTKALVGVDLRVVDATTAEILGSYPGRGEESKSKLLIGHSDIGAYAMGSTNFMESILGKATRQAMVDWCDNLCDSVDRKKLLLTPKNQIALHPDGAVVYVEGTTCITNCGAGKGYTVGDKVEIHRKGRELKDPDTGEILKVLTELVATGTVIEVDNKTANIVFRCPDPSKLPKEGDIVKFVAAKSDKPQ